MRTVHRVSAIVLSICILIGAAVFVSAGIGANKTVLPSNIKTTDSDSAAEADTTQATENSTKTFSQEDDSHFDSDENGSPVSVGENGSVSKIGAGSTQVTVSENSSNGIAAQNNKISIRSQVSATKAVNETNDKNSEEAQFDYNDSDDDSIFAKSYSRIFTSSSDSYTYFLTAEKRGAIICKLKHDALSAGGYKMCLYIKYSPNGDGNGEAWRLINELETTAAAGKYTSAEIGVSAGSYKAVVSCLNQNVPDKEYTASFVFKESSEYECEYNDTVTRYNEITAGQTVKGSASYFSSGKDCDWYMFRVYENSAMSFVFEHEKKDLTSVCWIISVYDADGNELYSDNSYFSTESLRSGKIGMQKGCYFIKIESRVYNAATYSLKIYKDTDAAYESECNDTRESANAIKADTAVTGELSSRSSGSDTDYYKLTLTESGICRFVFSHEPDADEVKNVLNGDLPKNGWRITVTDANSAAIYSCLSSWDSSETKSPEIGLGAGTYYVKIDSTDLYYSKTPYTLNASFESSSSWEQEPNGTFETANGIDSVVNGTISFDEDTDCYRFTVTDESKVLITLKHETCVSGENSIFKFGLYDENGKELCIKESYGTDKTVSAEAYNLSNGTYCIKVTAGTKYESIKYGLSLEVTK